MHTFIEVTVRRVHDIDIADKTFSHAAALNDRYGTL